MIDEDRSDNAACVRVWTDDERAGIEKRYKKTIYDLYPPDGWAFSGDFRTGKPYETYLDSCEVEPTPCHLGAQGDPHNKDSERLILIKLPENKPKSKPKNTDIFFKEVVKGLYSGTINGEAYHIELVDDEYRFRRDHKLIDYLKVSYDDGSSVSVHGDVPRHIWNAAKEGK